MNEFSLIDRYFKRPFHSKTVTLGIGDDTSLMQIPAGYELATTVDALVENTHFFPGENPYNLGWKSLAVSLSDLAAMNAKPEAAFLSLILPEANEEWLSEFSRGFFALADQFDVPLVGGNMAKGPLSITTTLQGIVPAGQALKRSGAKPGDGIYVAGFLGEAGAGQGFASKAHSSLPFIDDSCEINSHESPSGENHDSPPRTPPIAGISQALLAAWQRPHPQIKLGLALRSIASSCIDVSDGFLADLQHILEASQVGATVDLEKILISDRLLAFCKNDRTAALQLACTAGEDYLLCFTVPAEKEKTLQSLSEQLGPITRIGEIEAKKGLRFFPENAALGLKQKGFQHF